MRPILLLATAAALTCAAKAQDASGPFKDIHGYVSTLYAPTLGNYSETVVAYSIAQGYSLGIAYAWDHKKIRPVSTVQFINELGAIPSLTWRNGIGPLGIADSGQSGLFEKTFGPAQLFAGISLSSSYGEACGVAGARLKLRNGLTFGFQANGKDIVSFISYSHGPPIIGVSLINGEHPAYVLGWRF